MYYIKTFDLLTSKPIGKGHALVMSNLSKESEETGLMHFLDIDWASIL